ncbi:Vegetative incompatibility protein HET-E-1 [Ceratobasidium sp. AG-Ba]|nr:Vegetative incompatibility protein HET-E-1 [Ceratobasidium sp. AG-Ba]
MADEPKRFRRIRRLYHKLVDDNPPNPEQNTSQASVTPIASGDTSHQHWGGLKLLANCLSKTPGSFGPLKDAADILLSWIETFEIVAEDRIELEALKIQLDGLFNDLREHINASRPPTMTASIKNLAQDITTETERLEHIRKRNGTSKYLKADQDAEQMIKCYQRIEALFRRLTLNANLDTWKTVNDIAADNRLKALPNSSAAYYRSTESTSLQRDACTPNTRVELLKQLYDWACDKSGPRIYWLNGMAGTGKTTVAYSFCERLEKNHTLAASFFCSRQLPECSKVGRIVPSISYQLSCHSHAFRHVLSSVLEQNPEAHNRRVSDQLKELVVDVASKIEDVLPTNLIVVIDALDECDSDVDVDLMLSALLAHATDTSIKFFVTSRPNANILNRMRDRQGEKLRTELRLHELEHPIVQKDIRTYLNTALQPRLNLSHDEIEVLVERSGVLFIYAATVVRYIGSKNFTQSKKRLKDVLDVSESSQNSSTKAIDALYKAIVDAAFDDEDCSEEDRASMLLVIHTVICAREPLSKRVLAGLLKIEDEDTVHNALLPLLSVLNVSEPNGVVTNLHESFRDYLLDRSRSGRFYCDYGEHNTRLAQLCFYHMGVPPQFNICELETTCLLDEDVPSMHERVNSKISGELFYVCRYWDAHVMSASVPKALVHEVTRFLSERLMMWMEVMNLKNSFAHGIRMVYEFELWHKDIRFLSEEAVRLLSDVWRFMNGCYSSPVLGSTAHIYASALLFWPKNSPMRSKYKLGALDIVGEDSTSLRVRRATPLVTITMRHYGRCAAYSPSGKHIAVGLAGGDVEIRDAVTGQRIGQPLVGHDKTARWVAYSPDGAHIVSGSYDESVRIWSVHTGEQVGHPLWGHGDSVTSVAYSPDGSYIVSGSFDKTVRIWSARTGEQIGQPFQGHGSAVYTVACSPDGAHIVSGSWDNTLRIWGAHTGRQIGQSLQGHHGLVNSVAYSPDGSHIVSGSTDKTVRIWSVHTREQVGQSLRGHSEPVNSVAYSPDGSYIISGSNDGTARIWSVNTGEQVGQSLLGHHGSVDSVACSPDGGHIVSCSRDTVRIWSVQDGVRVGRSLQGHRGPISSVAYSPDSTHIVSGSWDRTVRIWSARTGEQVGQSLQGHDKPVNSVAYSPNGAHIASGSDDRTVCIWSVLTGEQVQSLQGHDGSVNSVAYSPDGSHIVSGSDDSTVRIWSVRTGEQVGQSLQGHDGSVTSVAYSPDGIHIVSSGWDNSMRIWSMHTGEQVGQSLQGHGGPVRTVAYSPNGTHIVSGSSDNTVRIWSVHTGEQAGRSFHGHDSQINSVAYSPDGAYIISGSSDNTVRIWSVDTGEQVSQSPQGEKGSVFAVALSPNGAQIVSGSLDCTLRILGLQTLEQVGQSVLGGRTWVNSVACSPNTTSILAGSDGNSAHRQPPYSPLEAGQGLLSNLEQSFARSSHRPDCLYPTVRSHTSHICHSACRATGSHCSWTLNEQGWAVLQTGELLVWIPPDLRITLLRPEFSMIASSKQGVLYLEPDRRLLGKQWASHLKHLEAN